MTFEKFSEEASTVTLVPLRKTALGPMIAVLPALIVPVMSPMSHRKYAIEPTAAVASAGQGSLEKALFSGETWTVA